MEWGDNVVAAWRFSVRNFGLDFSSIRHGLIDFLLKRASRVLKHCLFKPMQLHHDYQCSKLHLHHIASLLFTSFSTRFFDVT
mmetsp:Transcript_4304/g.9257  ORF Transcript_4304/g.9257 Transcript_4304/m.9257 type:complete len:82 (-) Transcript_4304:177-422(-)